MGAGGVRARPGPSATLPPLRDPVPFQPRPAELQLRSPKYIMSPHEIPGALWDPSLFAAPAGAPWTPTRYIPGQTKVKAVHIAPQGIGFGGPALDYPGWVDIARHAGEDTGLWNHVAGLASAVLPDDDVAMLAALVGRVEQILIDQLFTAALTQVDYSGVQSCSA